MENLRDYSGGATIRLRDLVPEEGYQRITDYLVSNSKRWYPHHGVTKADAFELGGDIIPIENTSTVCHAFITSGFGEGYYGGDKLKKCRDKNMGKPWIVGTCHSKVRSPDVDPDAHSAIATWMANDSPFARYVVNKDDHDVITNSGLMLLCQGEHGIQSSHQAMWVCKVLRYCTENSNAIDVWYYLYKNGIPPVFALYVSEYFKIKYGPNQYGSSVGDPHVSVFYGLEKAPSFLVNPEVQDIKQVDRTSRVFKFSHLAPKADGYLSAQKPRNRDVSDGWGGNVSKKYFSLEDILEITKEYMEKLKG